MEEGGRLNSVQDRLRTIVDVDQESAPGAANPIRLYALSVVK